MTLSLYGKEVSPCLLSECEQIPLIQNAALWVISDTVETHQVSCRWVMQDCVTWEPSIKVLDCPKQAFATEFPLFLEECVGALIERSQKLCGCVVVGKVSSKVVAACLQQYHHFLSEYGVKQLRLEGTSTFIENPSCSLTLAYQVPQIKLDLESDLKRVWVQALIQLMTSYRIKEQLTHIFPTYLKDQDHDLLFPVTAFTGSLTASYFKELIAPEGPLCKILKTVHQIKQEGFKEIELINALWRLKKKIKPYAHTPLTTCQIANYWSSCLLKQFPLIAPIAIIPDSLELLSHTTLKDICEEMNAWFKENLRVVQFQSCDNRHAHDLKRFLHHHSFDHLICRPLEKEPETFQDPFLDLVLTAEEEDLLLFVIQKVAKTNPLQLGLMIRDLEKKRMQLMHIHPLKSMAFFLSTPESTAYLEMIVSSLFKGPSFIRDFSKRMKQELEQNHLMMYVPGFCSAVNVNPAQVYYHIQTADFEGLINYLITRQKGGL
ncbi:MAG: hypothetical protein QRY72_03545 [Candidatus Rhabdochlamydia sp.]